MVFPRLWSVAHKHGYITAADFVRGRFGNRWLALAIALTGIVATMPYIALQLVGMQVVIGAHGRIETTGPWRPAADHRVRHPRGLHLHQRAARARHDRRGQGHADLHRGHRGDDRRCRSSWAAIGKMFAAVPPAKLLLATPARRSLGSLAPMRRWRSGSALALFLYPHSVTGVLSVQRAA